MSVSGRSLVYIYIYIYIYIHTCTYICAQAHRFLHVIRRRTKSIFNPGLVTLLSPHALPEVKKCEGETGNKFTDVRGVSTN